MISDSVNHPQHYNTREVETIDLIDLFLEGKDGLTLKQGHYLATALKYLDRFPFKGNPTMDLQKAIWYIVRLLDTIENKEMR